MQKDHQTEHPLSYRLFRLSEFQEANVGMYYDCVDKYLDRSDFQPCVMDTDNAYMAPSSPSLESLVKAELKHHWFRRTDKEDNRAHDKRTSGLFKDEWQGCGIIGLFSKTYYASVARALTEDVTKRQVSGRPSVQTR